MNIFSTVLQNFSQTSSSVPEHVSIAIVLISATCIGNDGKVCPLFHGTLGCRVFSDICDNEQAQKLQQLVFGTNCLTWSTSVFLPENATECRRICNKFSRLKYSAKQIRKIYLHAENAAFCSEFILENCDYLQEIFIWGEAPVENLDFLVKKKNLEVVSCAGRLEVDKKVYETFGKMTWLKHLDLSYNSFLIDDEILIEHISKISSLEILNLSGCHTFFNEGIESLASLDHLQVLDLSLNSQDFTEGTPKSFLNNNNVFTEFSRFYRGTPKSFLNNNNFFVTELHCVSFSPRAES